MTDPAEFRERHRVDDPGIVGAAWWNQSLEQAQGASPRRAFLSIALASAGIGAVGVALMVCGMNLGGHDEDYAEIRRASLDLQREHGWSFGAPQERLVFTGASTEPFDRSALVRMPQELAPRRAALLPFHSSTLFEAPRAVPRQPVAGDSPAATLAEALVPIKTPEMEVAYRRGRAVARLLARATDVALVVDLPGPEAVAFAAGLADVFDPVFLFDNWPHPRGVVPAHLTLAAAVHYQPHLVKARDARKDSALPAFVLDRARLTPYRDDATQFDNRWFAKLPLASQLGALGVRRVLYVVPTDADRPELDDLNVDFVAWRGAGVDVRMLAASDFAKDEEVAPAARAALEKSGDWPPYFYGGDDRSQEAFFSEYGWGDVGGGDSRAGSARARAARPSGVSDAAAYSPGARTTLFSGLGAAKVATGVALGTAAVAVARGSSRVLGARHGTRSGSFTRTSGRSSFG